MWSPTDTRLHTSAWPRALPQAPARARGAASSLQAHRLGENHVCVAGHGSFGLMASWCPVLLRGPQFPTFCALLPGGCWPCPRPSGPVAPLTGPRVPRPHPQYPQGPRPGLTVAPSCKSPWTQQPDGCFSPGAVYPVHEEHLCHPRGRGSPWGGLFMPRPALVLRSSWPDIPASTEQTSACCAHVRVVP